MYELLRIPNADKSYLVSKSKSFPDSPSDGVTHRVPAWIKNSNITWLTPPWGLVEMPEPGTPALAHGLIASNWCFHGYDDDADEEFDKP